MKLLRCELSKLGIIIAAIAAAVAIASPAMAGFSITGDFEGWTGTGVAMTETFLGSGIWQVTLDPGAGRHEFKVTDGSWANSWPGPNSWLQNGAGGNVNFSFNTNIVSDGWLTDVNRIGLSVDPGAWTAVGDWQSQVGGGNWDNANPNTVMTSLGGGIYKFSATLAPGTYAWKVVNSGSWDSISTDARSIATANASFTTTLGTPTAEMYVDALNGTVKVNLIPEPSTFALLGFGLIGALVLRRRKA